jgi:cobalt/nickel transport system permease protein
MRMHMANEMLSVPVAAGTLGIAGGVLAAVCRAARKHITPEKMPLMGILGAFIFAAQMVNFQLPLMPGTSGHFIGAVLLAIILGPHLGTIVISSVIILQCLIFQDGGILALGCNIINMAIVPCYLGYLVYSTLAPASSNTWRKYGASICACIVAIEAGAILVPYEAAVSEILAVPLKTFLIAMTGVHLVIAICEGVLTAAILGFLQKTRPDISTRNHHKTRPILASFAVAAIALIGVSPFASKLPDGLEWAWSKSIVDTHKTQFAEPNTNDGWMSLAALGGSAMAMGVIYAAATVLRKRENNCLIK